MLSGFELPSRTSHFWPECPIKLFVNYFHGVVLPQIPRQCFTPAPLFVLEPPQTVTPNVCSTVSALHRSNAATMGVATAAWSHTPSLSSTSPRPTWRLVQTVVKFPAWKLGGRVRMKSSSVVKGKCVVTMTAPLRYASQQSQMHLVLLPFSSQCPQMLQSCLGGTSLSAPRRACSGRSSAMLISVGVWSLSLECLCRILCPLSRLMCSLVQVSER